MTKLEDSPSDWIDRLVAFTDQILALPPVPRLAVFFSIGLVLGTFITVVSRCVFGRCLLSGAEESWDSATAGDASPASAKKKPKDS